MLRTLLIVILIVLGCLSAADAETAKYVMLYDTDAAGKLTPMLIKLDLGSVEVTTVDGALTLRARPPKVHAIYAVAPAGKPYSGETLPHKPAADSLTVHVNGVLMRPGSDYTYNETTGAVALLTAIQSDVDQYVTFRYTL